MVRDYRTTTGFPWTHVMGDAATLRRLRVIETDTKFVVDSRGVITYQAGSGVDDARTWQTIFQRLVA